MAGFAAPVGVAATGLAASGATPGPAVPALWLNADALASIMAMATIVILCMERVLIPKFVSRNGANEKSTLRIDQVDTAAVALPRPARPGR
jgi:hypothetical protein